VIDVVENRFCIGEVGEDNKERIEGKGRKAWS